MTLAASPLIEVVPGLMIWTLICFAITFFVLKKFAFGPIQNTIDERRKRIRDSVEEAERARTEARELLEEHRALIGAETVRALEQIRAEVAELALAATSKVTGKVLDREDHRKLIEDAIGDLDFSVLERERA
jgi:F-type H+-transporting ATPase subunit b